MSALPDLGRAQHLATLQASAERAVSGERVAVAVHGTPGSGKSRLLDEFERRLREVEELEIRRSQAFPASATRPGGVADDLQLDELAADRATVLIVDDAQWSDPTSLTRLRTILLEPGGSGLLVVLAHRPLDTGAAPVLDRLIEATGRRNRLVRLTLGPISVADLVEAVEGSDRTAIAERLIASSGGVVSELEALVDQLVEEGSLRRAEGRIVAVRPISEWPEARSLHQRIAELPSDERLLVHSAVVAGHPLPLSVAAELLGRDPDDALEVAERLVDDGFLTEHANGFQPRTGPEAESLAAELGEVRKTRIFERLADAMTAAGLQEREPGLVGLQFLRAQRWEDALSQLSEAGLAAAKTNALAEALPLVSGALEALEHVGTSDPELAGRLYFARARCHRMLGSSDLADDDAAEATRLLTGDERMRALGWQAQIADDDQRATVGEWLAAAAELEAARLGDLASQGVNLTLRAKMLGRLGLPVEADACLTRGIRLLRQHGDPYLHFFGHYNGGWVSFDRGLVRQAEAGFEYSVSQARSFDGEQFHADSQAWWSRTLFWSGRISDALEVFDSARDTADRADSQGAIYLTALARAEGMILLGRYDDALAYAEETLGHVRRLGMAWENVARYLIAAAHLGAGRLDDALEEAELAVAGCPPGNDGQRWRLACQALALEIRGARGEPWPTVEAATLTRELLTGRWLAPATRLLVARARHEQSTELGRWAVAIALEMGVPMLAARAAVGRRHLSFRPRRRSGDDRPDPRGVARRVGSAPRGGPCPRGGRGDDRRAAGGRGAAEGRPP
jgi:tetratricopeptide (TPR) repeat protein